MTPLTAVPDRAVPDRAALELRRAFLAHALSHDAVDDGVKELLFDHVVAGKYHASVVASSLKPLLDRLLEETTADDWQAVADAMIADARAELATVAASAD